jgi:hypothetical protein
MEPTSKAREWWGLLLIFERFFNVLQRINASVADFGRSIDKPPPVHRLSVDMAEARAGQSEK